MITQQLSNSSSQTYFAKESSTDKTKNSTSSDDSTDLGGTAASEQMFLQLLVAQLKNQDPTSPSDPSQFVSQLAQFSQLEQVIAIRQDVDAFNKSAGATSTSTDKNASSANRVA